MNRNPSRAVIMALAWTAGLLLAALPAAAQTTLIPLGSGTALDPYRISELGHLVWMGDSVGASAGTYHVLLNDIDAAATATWNDEGTDAGVLEGFRPIGTPAVPFMGEFAGQGHVIRGVTMARPEQSAVGLFGWIGSGGAVRRLGLEGGAITGGSYVGALAGGNEGGTVESCFATGRVAGGAYVGGLLGYHEGGRVESCFATGPVTGSAVVGGLLGYSHAGSLRTSHATGAVAGDDDVGGLAGYNDGSTVEQCYATGAVAGGAVVGGLLGLSYYGTIRQCHATGMVTANEDVGGLVGYSEGGTVVQCYASGAVAGSAVVGGLLGCNGDNSTVAQGYATGATSGTANVGGLVGWNGGALTQCYASGVVTGTTAVGGLVGYAGDGTAEQCYWDTERSRQATSAGGEGQTTAAMRQAGTYADWDFTTVWSIAAERNEGYPYLQDAGLWLVRFLAGANGVVIGETSQRVADAQGASPVTAVPAYAFVFAQWSDGSTENPRTLAAVYTAIELTASFRPAGPVATATGVFLAVIGSPDVEQGRGLWDLSGTYATTVNGYPLTLHLDADARGRTPGTAVLAGIATGGKALVAADLSVMGTVRTVAGAPRLRLALRGVDTARTVRVNVTLDLALDREARQLRGPALGSIRTAAETIPLTDSLALDLPADVDGSWMLLFDLAPRGRASVGTALLALPNGAEYLFAVAGTPSGRELILSLSGLAGDPAAKGIRISATVTPLEGGWARLAAFSALGYGQTLRW